MHPRLVMTIALSLTQVLLSCAQLGGPEGGAANLPDRGVKGYTPISHGTPPSSVVLSPPTALSQIYREPYAVRTEDGVTLLFEIADSTSGHSWIASASSPDGIANFTEAEPILGGPNDIRAYKSPTWACRDGECILASGSSDESAFYFARGPQGGPMRLDETLTFENTENFEAGGIANPSLAYDPDQDVFRLVYQTRPSEDDPPMLAMASLSPSGQVQKHGTLDLLSDACLSPTDEPIECWDSQGRESPEVRRALTATGRGFWRLTYTGIGPEKAALGFAASWAGDTFTAFSTNPGFKGQRSEGSNIRFDSQYFLYFVSTSPWGPSGISLAHTTEGYPADTF